MEQENENTYTPPKEPDDVSEQATKMDTSCEGPHEMGSKAITATPVTLSDKGAIENGLPHISDDNCKDDIEGSELQTEKVDNMVDKKLDSSSSSKATPVKMRTCKLCLLNETTENELPNSEEYDAAEQVQCDKCHREFTTSDCPVRLENKSHTDKTAPVPKQLEKCPMCEMAFESAELLDEHLLSPESCRRITDTVLPQNIAKDSEGINSPENLRPFEEHSATEDDHQGTSKMKPHEKHHIVESGEHDSKNINEMTEQSILSEGIKNSVEEAQEEVEVVSSPKNDENPVDSLGESTLSEGVEEAQGVGKLVLSPKNNESITNRLGEAKDVKGQLSSPKLVQSALSEGIKDSLEEVQDVDELVSSPENNESITDSLGEAKVREEQVSSPNPEQSALLEGVKDSVEEAQDVEELVSSPENNESIMDSLGEAKVREEQLSSTNPEQSALSEGVKDSVEEAQGVKELVSSPKNDKNVVDSLCEAKDIEEQLSSSNPEQLALSEGIKDSVEEAQGVEELVSSPTNDENVVDSLGEAKDIEEQLSSSNPGQSALSEGIKDSVEEAQGVEELVSSPTNDENVVDSLGEAKDVEEQLSSSNPGQSALSEGIKDSVEKAQGVDLVSSPKNNESITNSLGEGNGVEEQMSSPKSDELIEDSRQESKTVEEQLLSAAHDETIEEMSPVLTCNDIEEPVETNNVEKLPADEEDTVPVAPVPVTATVVVENDAENSPCTSSKQETLSYNDQVDECPNQQDINVAADANSLTKSASFQDADSKAASESESGVIEIIDSDSEDTSVKLPSPTEVNAKDKTTVKTSSIPTTGSTNDENVDDNSKGEKSALKIKKKYTTGNETLDQDVVEILQDANKTSGRVTRSMRRTSKVVPGDDKVSANKPGLDGKSPQVKAAKCKLSISPTTSGKPQVRVATQSAESDNGTLLLKVPASSVQSGAKFIVTIPQNNSSQTPAGKYLITVPPTDPSSGKIPQAKTVLLKASTSVNTTFPTTVKPANAGTDVSGKEMSTTSTSAPQLTSMLNKPSEIISEPEVPNEEVQATQLKKTIMLTKQTNKVYVKELEQIDEVIFECPKCKAGFPHMLLVQLHMEDCCHHPPTQTPSIHIRIPTEILLKFYEKHPSPNRQNYKCLCCQEMISFRNYRIGKYYPSLATHFAKHTYPSVKVVNYTEHSKTKQLGDVITVHSKQAVEWIDHMVPPFTLGNQPISSKQGTLDGYLCTSNKLHQESLLLLEYDSDELDDEIYLERQKKDLKKKKRRRGRSGADDSGAYVCNWKSAIVKEDSNIVEVTEIGTPKSAFPADIHKSGSLKHSILHSPSKITPKDKKDSTQSKSGSKKKKDKSKKEASKQLFVEDNINRRRSPRKGGTENVFLSLPQKKKRRERSLEKDTPKTSNKTSKSKNASSEDDIILLSSEEDSQHSINSKETDVLSKSTKNVGPHTLSKSKETSASLPRQESIDDESSRGSLPSLPESTTKSQDSLEAQRSSVTSSRPPSVNVSRAENEDGDSRQGIETQGGENEERPPSRGSSIICLSDSNEEEEETVAKTQNKTLIQQRNTSTKSIMQKVAKNNAAQDNNKQKIPQITDSVKGKGEASSSAKASIEKVNQASADKVVEEVKKRKVPEPEVVDTEDVTLLSDIEDDEDDGVDLNSDNYGPILLDKHQVKTYFQMSREEPGIYECSLGGCTSCDCVAESDLFEHLSQHIHVEKVHPQKRSKTILFKGKVVPQYLKLTRHQIWAHFCNITLDSDMEICDEYMQQYKQCRWANCSQRVWTKYGRLSHHLRSHLRFTQIDVNRYEKMREERKISGADNSYQTIPQYSPVKDTRLRVSDGDQVLCLPEDFILGKYRYGKSPSVNVRGTFNCLACEYCHHLDSNASAVMTVKILACHLKQHLPLSRSHTCLITPKALKSHLKPDDYAAGIRAKLPNAYRDLESIEDLPEVIVTSCYDMLKMKFIEPAAMGAIMPILNKDGVLYRCLYLGCQIGIVGEKRKALLKHIKEHAPAITEKEIPRQGRDGSDPLPQYLEDPVNESTMSVKEKHGTEKRKRRASAAAPDEESNETVTHSKHRKISDTNDSLEAQNVNCDNMAGTAEMDDASSDGDIVELIEVSSQDSSQVLSEGQPLESASQEDSQESMETSVEGSSTMDVAIGDSTVMDGSDRSDLPEWSNNNRGVNSVTGIEPSRDNPSRSMDELRHNPNDVIVCSMPDVEAYFCEHIVKYSSYVSTLSDKVTFGKPSYSCPECGETGLKGVALKQHLESHVGKTIKWKTLTKNALLPGFESETEHDSPRKHRTMTKLKRSSANRVLSPLKMKLSPRKWEGKNGLLRYNAKDIRLVGQGVRRARQNFNSVLSRILNRERNLRRGKMTRSPIKRLSPFGLGFRTFRRSVKYGNLPSRNLGNDLSTQVKQGQSSSNKDAENVKQSQTVGEERDAKQGVHGESCISKSNTSQTEVIDLVDEGTSDIISVGSDEMEMSNAMQKGQANEQISVEAEEPQGDDLFLTIEDILKEHFTKEEKQRSRKGIGMNFIVVQYKCKRCSFTTLTVLDVPEHVAFHIKRKVILKIKMDK